jgi:hypothetical protein
MIYYEINYYYNNFFIINEKYYIYIKPINNKHIYDIINNNNKLYLRINGKNIKKKEDIILILINNQNKCVNINLKNIRINYIEICNIDNLDNYEFNYEISIINNFINYDKSYYIQNNKFINKLYINNEKYINYHWLLCGQYNPYLYFKYLLKKYEDIIFKINYIKINYDNNKKNTLLFIDNRYDSSFIYLLILFCYSIDETWNINVFTTIEHINEYQKDFDKLGINGKIHTINIDIKTNNDYSTLLKDHNFWKRIIEENVLIFQYDSFCMGKFDNIFYNYNYIGARWPHKACKYHEIKIGNGGTSFRKTRVIENMCKKYSNIKNNCPEDVFICELLYENNLHNCTIEIADKFAFENIFNDNSIYAHQIYNTVKLSDMDKFIYDKIILLK